MLLYRHFVSYCVTFLDHYSETINYLGICGGDTSRKEGHCTFLARGVSNRFYVVFEELCNPGRVSSDAMLYLKPCII